MKKIIFGFLFVLILLTTSGCATRKLDGTDIVPPDYKSRKLSACLPEAIEMMQKLRASNLEANVVIYKFRKYNETNPKNYTTHAITVYFAPPGANQLWGWDADIGSARLFAYRDNAAQIARSWIKMTGWNTIYVVSDARFLESNWR